jgi:hypothetical protein
MRFVGRLEMNVVIGKTLEGGFGVVISIMVASALWV